MDEEINESLSQKYLNKGSLLFPGLSFKEELASPRI